MSYSLEQWEKTKALFESGQYSLSQISEKTGIDKSQISRKSKMQQWSSGRNADYIEAKVKIATKKTTENTTTLQILDDIADEKTRHLKLIHDNATKLANKISTMTDQIDTPNDLKTLVDANDRLAITLKVADRHARNGDVNVQTNTAVQANVIKTIDDFYT
jgi:membrane-bound ClpP family serine protease